MKQNSSPGCVQLLDHTQLAAAPTDLPACPAMQTLRRPPYSLLEGDFVRADCRVLPTHPGNAAAVAAAGDGGRPAAPASQPWRVMKKDEVLDFGNCVCRVMTNRRGNWQKS